MFTWFEPEQLLASCRSRREFLSIGHTPQSQSSLGRSGLLEPSPVPTILVIDDDRDMLALMAYELGKAGYQVRLALDAVEARKLMVRETFDLVICDLLLPGLSGRSFGQQLAGEPDHPTLLFISAGEAVHGSLPGAFLRKPFQADALVAVVHQLLNRP